MVATFVNFIAIILGSVIGITLKKFIREDITKSVLKAIGIVVLIISVLGVIKHTVTIEENMLKTNYELLLIITVALGTFIGEYIDIDKYVNRFGKFVEKKLNKSKISEAFINSTLIFSVGAMAIVGSISAGLGDHSIIYMKSALDGVTSIILASTLGIGVIFSSFIVLFYQGVLTLLSMWLGDFLPIDFISGFSAVGYVLVACLSLNFIMEKKIKVANMIPSLLLVVLYFLLF